MKHKLYYKTDLADSSKFKVTIFRFAFKIVSFYFTDLIIGAPYEDNNKGAIYVFNGGSPKMTDTYSQRILASNVNSNLRGFGFSLSKSNIDVDANTYVGTLDLRDFFSWLFCSCFEWPQQPPSPIHTATHVKYIPP